MIFLIHYHQYPDFVALAICVSYDSPTSLCLFPWNFEKFKICKSRFYLYLAFRNSSRIFIIFPLSASSQSNQLCNRLKMFFCAPFISLYSFGSSMSIKCFLKSLGSTPIIKAIGVLSTTSRDIKCLTLLATSRVSTLSVGSSNCLLTFRASSRLTLSATEGEGLSGEKNKWSVWVLAGFSKISMYTVPVKSLCTGRSKLKISKFESVS